MSPGKLAARYSSISRWKKLLALILLIATGAVFFYYSLRSGSNGCFFSSIPPPPTETSCTIRDTSPWWRYPGLALSAIMILVGLAAGVYEWRGARST